MRARSRIRVGPAGWSYPDWNGIVYPRPKPKGFDPLGYLALFFPMIEINNTFYRPQPAHVAEDWAARVAHSREFRFTAKLNRRFTHQRDETFSAAEVAETRETFDVLQRHRRLGAVLLQFPWSFKREREECEWLNDVLSAFAGLPLVVEVRHSSWDVAEFYAELSERGVGFVNVDQPRFQRSMGPGARTTTPWTGYIRVHGRNFRDWFRKTAHRDERYDYLYSAQQLEPWAERAQQMADEDPRREIYVVTNNHVRGQAIANAAMIRSMVEEEPVAVPEGVFERYEEALKAFARPVGDTRAVKGCVERDSDFA